MPEGVREAVPVLPDQAVTYATSFAGGHLLTLLDRADTFRVSNAGQALGDLLVQSVTEAELAGRVLDVGTGSGVLALLLRRLGATQITATDICPLSVLTAARNELLNFDTPTVQFLHGDPFPSPPPVSDAPPYGLIVFNPPGWRAPSADLSRALLAQMGSLALNAMFFGDEVIVRFLTDLPTQLKPGGRAIVGLNSLVGIEDVQRRAQEIQAKRGGPELTFRQLRRVELPLLYYTDEWAAVGEHLVADFERGRTEYGAHYTVVDGVIRWGYLMTEVTLGPMGSEHAPEAPLGAKEVP